MMSMNRKPVRAMRDEGMRDDRAAGAGGRASRNLLVNTHTPTKRGKHMKGKKNLCKSAAALGLACLGGGMLSPWGA